MKTLNFKIPVGGMPPFKKKWWQFWRKKGDSADEAIARAISKYSEDLNWKRIDRRWKINKIYSLGTDNTFPYKKDYWFTNRV